MGSPLQEIDRRIGARIRDLRLDRDLTLEQLAERSEVSRAMLSRIERAESSPTAQLLNKVCGGLGITLSGLFAATEAPAEPLARRDVQPIWRDPETGYLRRAVSAPGTGSPVEIVEVEFPAGCSVAFDNRRPDVLDQHVWVLDGSLELTLGDDAVRLEAGDCLQMRLDRPIRFRNPTRRSVRYAVILCRGIARP